MDTINSLLSQYLTVAFPSLDFLTLLKEEA
ncbi:hypothetical protein FX984_04529 [Pseudomonas marginalis]|nr:hypothetical protein FX984_04529 [Pseudomonas marginalis]PUB44199.1 hypothetical protein C8K58_106299 [Pseudomonas sp. GV047]